MFVVFCNLAYIFCENIKMWGKKQRIHTRELKELEYHANVIYFSNLI